MTSICKLKQPAVWHIHCLHHLLLLLCPNRPAFALLEEDQALPASEVVRAPANRIWWFSLGKRISIMSTCPLSAAEIAAFAVTTSGVNRLPGNSWVFWRWSVFSPRSKAFVSLPSLLYTKTQKDAPASTGFTPGFFWFALHVQEEFHGFLSPSALLQKLTFPAECSQKDRLHHRNQAAEGEDISLNVEPRMKQQLPCWAQLPQFDKLRAGPFPQKMPRLSPQIPTLEEQRLKVVRTNRLLLSLLPNLVPVGRLQLPQLLERTSSISSICQEMWAWACNLCKNSGLGNTNQTIHELFFIKWKIKWH